MRKKSSCFVGAVPSRATRRWQYRRLSLGCWYQAWVAGNGKIQFQSLVCVVDHFACSRVAYGFSQSIIFILLISKASADGYNAIMAIHFYIWPIAYDRLNITMQHAFVNCIRFRVVAKRSRCIRDRAIDFVYVLHICLLVN